MVWIIERPDEFLKDVSKHRKNRELFIALDNKIKRLEIEPESVGGKLAGRLYGNQSTRLVRKYRLIFRIDEANHKVFLLAIDHRDNAYD